MRHQELHKLYLKKNKGIERSDVGECFRKRLRQGLFLILCDVDKSEEPFMLHKAWEILYTFPNTGIKQIRGPPALVKVMLGS